MWILHGAQQLFLLALCTRAAGVDPWSVSSDDFARLIWTPSLIIGDYLYMDGGYYDTYINGEYTPLNILNDTLSIDLSRSWDVSDVVVNAFSKPAEWYGSRAGAFWWDRNTQTALAYGGEFFAPVTNLSTFYVWELQPDGAGGGTWSARATSDDSNWNQQYPGGYASITQSNTTGYFLGGFNDYGGVYPFIAGMMEYNFEQQSWTNVSTIGQYYASGLATHGSVHFVEGVGVEGMLLFMGGIQGDRDLGEVAPSFNITIYDPATGDWYSQQSTGAPIPEDRLDLCLVGVQESGTGSYEIYMWGGRGGGYLNYDAVVEDSQSIYILTLPAFHWIKVDAQATNYRAGPSCQVFGNQLISVGGYEPDQRITQDPWRYSVGIFDMTALQWKSSFNHTPDPYIRPDVVNTHYALGPAYPRWNFDAVEAAFSILDGSAAPNVSTSSPAPTESSASPTGTSSSSAPPPQNTDESSGGSSTNVGAIAGGVVGGVVVIAVILIWAFIRHWRNKRRNVPELAGTRTETAEVDGHKQTAPFEMGGQYDRPEISDSSQTHELDGNSESRPRPGV